MALVDVKGKVALVTGAAGGIGLAITKKLLKEGAKVMMVDLDNELGQSSLSGLCEEYPSDRISFSNVDVTDHQQLSDVFVRTKTVFGDLNIVCNNAGIVNGEHIWKRMFEVNVFAVIDSIQLAIEHMSTAKGGKGGVVINTASISGLIDVGMPLAKYGATKHAVVGYTRSMHMLSSTDGIRINCICPAVVDTPGIQKIVTDPPPHFPPVFVDACRDVFKMSPDEVSEGIFELITDLSRNGAVMTVIMREGKVVREYPKLLEKDW